MKNDRFACARFFCIENDNMKQLLLSLQNVVVVVVYCAKEVRNDRINSLLECKFPAAFNFFLMFSATVVGFVSSFLFSACISLYSEYHLTIEMKTIP